MNWTRHAEELARAVVHPSSRWHGPISTVPRHLLVPRWWDRGAKEWELRDGPGDIDRWLHAAYRDRTLVTRVGPLHADHSEWRTALGKPTSSATLPMLVVIMLRHALICDDSDVLCVVGSGYTSALLARRLGDRHVTAVDVTDYLVEAAAERLDLIGLHPTMATCDITGDLPGQYDRIVSTVAVRRRIPTSWLRALRRPERGRPGGRLVTTLADTGLIVTADITEDGGAVGRIEMDRAAFMAVRHGPDYPETGLDELAADADSARGDITNSRYPVIEVSRSWDLWSMLEVTTPGIEHRYRTGENGIRTAWMLAKDGSWAEAHGGRDAVAIVRQGGPRRLWSELERIRGLRDEEGSLPVYGARVTVATDGEITLSRGEWTVRL